MENGSKLWRKSSRSGKFGCYVVSEGRRFDQGDEAGPEWDTAGRNDGIVAKRNHCMVGIHGCILRISIKVLVIDAGKKPDYVGCSESDREQQVRQDGSTV